MNPRYGIDTSILVRLLTGESAVEFQKTVGALERILAHEPSAEIFASNQVIGEAYIAVQHHYGVTKVDARSALLSVFSSGLVSPLNGASALAAIRSTSGCGLLDRLIVDDYHQQALVTLTHDHKMAALPDARKL
jgi:predicted nucleic acid-binding protein